MVIGFSKKIILIKPWESYRRKVASTCYSSQGYNYARVYHWHAECCLLPRPCILVNCDRPCFLGCWIYWRGIRVSWIILQIIQLRKNRGGFGYVATLISQQNYIYLYIINLLLPQQPLRCSCLVCSYMCALKSVEQAWTSPTLVSWTADFLCIYVCIVCRTSFRIFVTL